MNPMHIVVPREVDPAERRVALVPDLVSRLIPKQWTVTLEAGAGERAYFSDEQYRQAGASIAPDRSQLWADGQVILTVGGLAPADLERLGQGHWVIGLLNPLQQPQAIAQLAQRGVTAFALELLPRSTRAQAMDALSSQASIAGYKAALMGAAALPKYLPMLTTAAGTIAPAKVLVIGAGVAGLQAIATCRRLGAIVEAFDIRPQVKEEVQSLGAKFIDIPIAEDTVADQGYAREMSAAAQDLTRATLAQHVQAADLVITTAQIPGRPAPRLIDADMVAGMKPGAVIVDLAAETGGNCAYTEVGRTATYHQVTIIGAVNVPAMAPTHASQLYGKNISALLQHLRPTPDRELDFTDEITASACVAHGGKVCHPRVLAALESPQTAPV
jgi:H+-translocating NAD(P) transhydrogenase subunit alpha